MRHWGVVIVYAILLLAPPLVRAPLAVQPVLVYETSCALSS